MNASKDMSETFQRVQAVDTKLAEKLGSIPATRTPSPDVSEKADAIRSKSSALTNKLASNESSVWTAITDEVNRDLNALEGDFDHFVQHLDKHYKD